VSGCVGMLKQIEHIMTEEGACGLFFAQDKIRKMYYGFYNLNLFCKNTTQINVK